MTSRAPKLVDVRRRLAGKIEADDIRVDYATTLFSGIAGRLCFFTISFARVHWHYALLIGENEPTENGEGLKRYIAKHLSGATHVGTCDCATH